MTEPTEPTEPAATRQFPVVAQRRLQPVPRRMFSAGRRDPAELPLLEPGQVLVFKADGRHEVFPDHHHLRGGEDFVVSAVAVSVVDTTPRLIEVELRIPSSNPANDFVLTVTFRCEAVQADLVAEAGMIDVVSPLRAHLQLDRALHDLGLGTHVDDLTGMRTAVYARISSYLTVHRATLPGMRISLAGVGVTSAGAVKQAQRIQDLTWDQQFNGLVREAQTAAAARIRELIERGPDAVEAEAAVLGEITMAQIARRLLTDRDAQVQWEREDEQRGYDRQHVNAERLQHFLDGYAQRGGLDRVPIDSKVLVEHYLREVVGVDLDAADPGRAGLGGDQRGERPGLAGSDDDQRPPVVRDDEDPR